MGGRVKEGFRRSISGGIISLARFTEEHREALNADLFGTGYSVDDLGRSLSWGSLKSYLSNIKLDSNIARDLDPDAYMWGQLIKTNYMLADIWDMLAMINANLVAIGSRKRAKEPKPYPRPGAKNDKKKHFGSGALTHKELAKWMSERRKKHV